LGFEGDGGDAVTQGNTNDNGSGDLVLDHQQAGSLCGKDELENDRVGVEVGLHFDNICGQANLLGLVRRRRIANYQPSMWQ
jgi:hypothetical protein